MALENFSLKFFAPKVMAKAMQSFDRATTVVVTACWSAAGVLIAAAIYTLILSISARHAADTALVAEPNLPKIIHKPMDLRAAQKVYDRMQHRFSDINFTVHGQDILVATPDGTKFRQWLTSLSYMDTISPEFHWSITSLCVGKCLNADIMHAAVTGERISFETPQNDAKD